MDGTTSTVIEVELFESDLREARSYLPSGGPDELAGFARRQLRARQRVARLLDFYGQNPCRLSRLHLLTSSSLAIARFCALSSAFDKVGAAIMPVNADGQPRTAAWQAYQEACQVNRPWTVRDEMWLEAHLADWRQLKAERLDEAFQKEFAEHPRDRRWQYMRRHLEMTLGTRRFDHAATSGETPYETAVARSISLSVRKMLTRGRPVLAHYFWNSLRELASLRREADRTGVVGYRRCAVGVFCSAVSAWSSVKVYRRGMRIGNRGRFTVEQDWPLLESILGSRVKAVHPLIRRFYANPGRFSAEASLKIRTLPLGFYSRLSAMLLGQGLYEQEEERIDARLRVFRRDDGSMHFVRELYCRGTLRVFDSDFVLREMDGRTVLVEVFNDLHIEVVLDVEPRRDGGVAVVGRQIKWRGIRLPLSAFRVEFVSRVKMASDRQPCLQIVGSLRLQPRSTWGQFIMYRILRRPRLLGSIQYHLTEDEWNEEPVTSDDERLHQSPCL